MSDETTNPGEKPVNDGGTTPQTDPDPTLDAAVAGEKPVNDGGGTVVQ